MVEKVYIEKIKDFFNSDKKSVKITKFALIALSLPIIVGGAVVMGNALQILKMFNKKKKYNTKQMTNAITTLKRQKLIECIIEKNGVTTIKITKKGESVIKHFAIEIISIKKPKKWDGKWRLVMFDLPIRFSKARDALRFKLKRLGFVQFQKSVWIYPYSCEDEILFVADHFKVGQYVEFLEISYMRDDQKLKRYFKLE